MEMEDFDSSFVFNGDPSIQLFPLILGGNDQNLTGTPTFNSSVFSGEAPATTTPAFFLSEGTMLTPSLASYYNNNLLTTLPPPPPPPPTQATNFTDFFNEDGYYYTPPSSERLRVSNSVVVPPQLSPPHELTTQPYDFFSPVPQPVESTQPYDFFSSLPDESTTTTKSVLKDTQTLESALENFSIGAKKPKRSVLMKKTKRAAAFDFGKASSSSASASLLTRQRISERVKCLRKLMPWITTKMDTATVLEEAFKYIMLLQEQIRGSVQSRPAISLDHNSLYANDPHNIVNVANVGGGGEVVLSREQIMEMVWKANVGQSFAGF